MSLQENSNNSNMTTANSKNRDIDILLKRVSTQKRVRVSSLVDLLGILPLPSNSVLKNNKKIRLYRIIKNKNTSRLANQVSLNSLVYIHPELRRATRAFSFTRLRMHSNLLIDHILIAIDDYWDIVNSNSNWSMSNNK